MDMCIQNTDMTQAESGDVNITERGGVGGSYSDIISGCLSFTCLTHFKYDLGHSTYCCKNNCEKCEMNLL